MHTLSDSQNLAISQLLPFLQGETQSKVALLNGAAGTGKTFVLKYLLEKAEARNIHFAASTHEAARVMMESINRAVSTFHSYFSLKPKEREGKFSLEQSRFYEAPIGAVLITDECSMLESGLLPFAESYLEMGNKILFVGDSYQLPPINEQLAFPFLPAFQSRYDAVKCELKEVHRQALESPILALATATRNRQPFLFTDSKELSRMKESELISTFLELFGSKQFKGNPAYARIGAYNNAKTHAVNAAIRKGLGKDAALFAEIGDVMVVNSTYIQNERVMFANNCLLEVLEAERLPFEGLQNAFYWQLKVVEYLDNYAFPKQIHCLGSEYENAFQSQLKKLAKGKNWKEYYALKGRFVDLRHRYCQTIHKLQGQTIQNVGIFDTGANYLRTKDIDAYYKLLYTAYTRASQRLILA